MDACDPKMLVTSSWAKEMWQVPVKCFPAGTSQLVGWTYNIWHPPMHNQFMDNSLTTNDNPTSKDHEALIHTAVRVPHGDAKGHAGQKCTCTHQHHTHMQTVWQKTCGLSRTCSVFISRSQDCYVECILFLFLDLTAVSKSSNCNIPCWPQEPRHRYAHIGWWCKMVLGEM